jgi:hypothetical protein
VRRKQKGNPGARHCPLSVPVGVVSRVLEATEEFDAISKTLAEMERGGFGDRLTWGKDGMCFGVSNLWGFPRAGVNEFNSQSTLAEE